LTLAVSFLEIEPTILLLGLDTVFFITTVWIFSFFLKKKKISWGEFGFGEVKIKWFVSSFFYIFLIIILGGSISKWVSSLLGLSNENLSLLKTISSGKLWLDILNLKLMMVILIPFAEELIFRGLIFRYIRQKKSFLFSAILSSLLFGILHFNFASMPFLIILGFVNAFVLERSKSMIYPVLIHGGVNNLAVNLFFLSTF
jgi:membrane protease YdiL (CAAX protease family)